MKKMLRMAAAVVMLALLAGSAAGTGEAQGKPVLVPVEMRGFFPPELPEEVKEFRFMGLSPDGKTMLCLMRSERQAEETGEQDAEKQGESEKTGEQDTEKQDESGKNAVGYALPGRQTVKRKPQGPKTETVLQLCLIRDGKLTPVRPNPERGAGDLYDNLKNILLRNWTRLPAAEGISWSADGRYVTFSNVDNSRANIKHMDVPVVDTETAELYLAERYRPNNILVDDGGIVFLSKMSRDGNYVYYLAYEGPGDKKLRFCRRTPEGDGREVLYETDYSDSNGFSFVYASDLIEAEDGSWILLAFSGNNRKQEESRASRLTAFRFSPAPGAWSVTGYSTELSPAWGAGRFQYSPVSGYGLLTVSYNNATGIDSAATMESATNLVELYRGLDRVNLLRLRPGADSFDTWYMRKTGEGPEEVEMVSGEEYRQYAVDLFAGLSPELPQGFDLAESYRHPIPLILKFCLSPDGRSALLNVRFPGDEGQPCRLYLLDPETMRLRYVEGSEAIASLAMSDTAMRNQRFGPGMVWNPDGTLVLAVDYNAIQFFRLEEMD